MIEKNEMPINSYLIMNSKAKLNNNQKAKLISWFRSLRNFESDKPKKINNLLFMFRLRFTIIIR